MELIGKVHEVSDVEFVGNNNTAKVTILLDTEEEFTQRIKIDFIGVKASLVSKAILDKTVTVSVNVRGTEWKGKHYVNLTGWRVLLDKNNQTVEGITEPISSEKIELSEDLPF